MLANADRVTGAAFHGISEIHKKEGANRLGKMTGDSHDLHRVTNKVIPLGAKRTLLAAHANNPAVLWTRLDGLGLDVTRLFGRENFRRCVDRSCMSLILSMRSVWTYPESGD